MLLFSVRPSLIMNLLGILQIHPVFKKPFSRLPEKTAAGTRLRSHVNVILHICRHKGSAWSSSMLSHRTQWISGYHLKILISQSTSSFVGSARNPISFPGAVKRVMSLEGCLAEGVIQKESRPPEGRPEDSSQYIYTII